ncbi:TIR domain-containing protein [Lentzea aerocolonigenes]|uniref:TIR domain-containing protein n=1 Tax=Lentzea aerocolonigenes TaxID=68170 RepID=UPI0004C37C24|nr:TIR domain-containing protein [Lentzea aerocolonigenes]MCP2250616.1 TIR domain-containing protein [Lentzea aerocolonigenes]
MSGGIFICYRKNHLNGRRSHALAVDAFIERLRTHFGVDKIRADTGLVAGDHFPSMLRGWLRSSEVVLVFVHQEWLDDLVEREDEDDWVRWELGTALEMEIRVIPVLLDKASLPREHELIDKGFADVAEFGNQQYWRILFGEWEQGGGELIRLLEGRVATEELPAPARPDPARQRSVRPLVAASLLGLAAPWLLVRLLVPDVEMRHLWLAALALALVFALVIPLGTLSIVYAVRVRLDESDEHLARLAHDQKTNVTVGLFVAGMGIIVLFSGNLVPWQGQLLVLAVIAGFTVVEGDRWLRDRRNSDLWPYVRLAPHPASVRGALTHAERFMKAHRPLLTMAQREQVEFVLGQVEWAVDRLHELCALSRWEWLRRSSPVLPAVHVLFLAAVIGSAVFAVVEGGWGHSSLLAGALIAALLCYVVTVDRAHRLQRWRRQVVAEAAPAEVERLRSVLAEISIPPAAVQENTE